jgi:hypothetical protein
VQRAIGHLRRRTGRKRAAPAPGVLEAHQGNARGCGDAKELTAFREADARDRRVRVGKRPSANPPNSSGLPRAHRAKVGALIAAQGR